MLLYLGSYRVLEWALFLLVVLMGLSFLTALMTRPVLGALFCGLLIATFSDASLLTVVGLIGTTVVPYNLFLHGSLVRAPSTCAMPG